MSLRFHSQNALVGEKAAGDSRTPKPVGVAKPGRRASILEWGLSPLNLTRISNYPSRTPEGYYVY